MSGQEVSLMHMPREGDSIGSLPLGAASGVSMTGFRAAEMISLYHLSDEIQATYLAE